MATELQELTDRIVAFRDARDWQQFHNPKDLATGLSIEAAELLELFLWKNGPAVTAMIDDSKSRIEEELADVFWYVLLLAHELQIDLPAALEHKLELNARKYPADQVRGSSRKYTEY